jgi:VanZ family protein
MKTRIGLQRLLDITLRPRYQRAVLLSLIAGLFFAGLHPFNFSPANQVSWLEEGRGLRFRGYGEVRGLWAVLPMRSESAIDDDSGITLELWVTCARVGPQVNDLLSVYHEGSQEPFAIKQSITDLIITAVARDAQGQQRVRDMSIDDAFKAGAQRFITITTSREGTTLYLEGLSRRTYPRLELARENLRGTVLLGQTSRAHQDWQGDVRGLAIYWKELSADEVAASYNAWRQVNWQESQAHAPAAAIYPFDEDGGLVVHNRGNAGGDLRIPERLLALHPVILAFPVRKDFTNVRDVTLNIIGFIPLGTLLVLYMKNRGWADVRAIVAAVATGLSISLVIELLQVLLPSRDSSLFDLINNTLGSGIGAWFGVAAWPCLQKMVPRRD